MARVRILWPHECVDCGNLTSDEYHLMKKLIEDGLTNGKNIGNEFVLKWNSASEKSKVSPNDAQRSIRKGSQIVLKAAFLTYIDRLQTQATNFNTRESVLSFRAHARTEVDPHQAIPPLCQAVHTESRF
eukprot:m.271107 g.271107  ORF g.271107 m.271107 type:complete len:129 (+) comp16088_c0_seq9:1942-2328(+)